MKTNKIYQFIAGFVLIAILGFTSCEKQEVVKVVGFVQGYAYDANTNEVLDNVTISWELPGGITDSTVATAADGFLISNLPSGYYLMKCSKENYATSIIEVEIPKDDIAVSVKGGGSKEYIVDAVPRLYSLDAKVTGRIYKYDNYEPYFGQITSPAANATVQLRYNAPIEKSMYVTTTDADGFFTFENVPAAAANVYTPEYIVDSQIHYLPASNYSGYLVPGSTTTASVVNLLPIESWYQSRLLLIGGNIFDGPNVPTNKFPVSSNITLKFSRILNQVNTEYYNSLVGGNGLVLYDQSSNPVPSVFTFSDNELIINPNADLNAGQVYSVYGFVWADLLHDYCNIYVAFMTAP